MTRSHKHRANLKLLNVSVEMNWPQVITSDKNIPLQGRNLVPAGRICYATNELAECHFKLCLTLEAENGRLAWANHLPVRNADTIEFLGPLMDEDMLLFACVVGFPDDSL